MNSTINAAASIEDRFDINNYLFTHQARDVDGTMQDLLAEDSQLTTLDNTTSAGVVMNAANTIISLPGTPVNGVAAAEFSAVTSVADGIWSKYVYKLYKDNNAWHTDPNWVNPVNDQLLTPEELIALLHVRAQNANYTVRRHNGKAIQSGDPNDKSGPQGAGEQHYITGTEPSSYTIAFENKPEATAPAQDVVITDQLDVSSFDLSTFQLGPVNFGTTVVSPPASLSNWTTDVDLRPANNLIVRLSAGLDKNTGIIRWMFTSLDPVTMQPINDPLGGFLPPNKTSPQGQGGVAFTVTPKAGLATNTQINNHATIVFDKNAPIDTNPYVNTIDNSNPTSSVTALSSSQPVHSFLVKWAGADTGSGLQDYTVFVSANGGPFTVWLADTTDTSRYFYGNASTSYSFYTIARDLAGNIQTAKTAADAATTTTAGNPIDDSQWFVRQHYLDFLGREPDPSGLQFWLNNIESCGADTQCREIKRINTSAAFFLSIEFQNTGFLAYRINKAAFGNLSGKPVPVMRSLFRFDTQQIADTPVQVVVGQAGWEQQLEANKVAFTQAFIARSAFISLYPITRSPTQFVDALFSNAGVTPSAAERQATIGEFGSAPDTSDASARARSLRDVAENPAFTSAEFSRTFVLMQYFGYLRRDPNATPDADFAGYNFWLNKLNQFEGNYINAEMVKAFISSDEYRHRFGP